MIIISVFDNAMEKDFYKDIIKGIVAGCDGTMIQDTLGIFQETYTASLLVVDTEVRYIWLRNYIDKLEGNCIVEWGYDNDIKLCCDGQKTDYYDVDEADVKTIIERALQYTKEDTITIRGID